MINLSLSCFPPQNEQIQDQVVFSPPVSAFDQDEGIDATLHYSILEGRSSIALNPSFALVVPTPQVLFTTTYHYIGNEAGYFSIDPSTGLIYRVRQVDYESLAEKTFALVVEARQKDNPLKTATAEVSLDHGQLEETR